VVASHFVRIAILGAGGVGGYFGARLAAGGADVVFIARGAHLRALRTSGLTVESPLGDLQLPRASDTDATDDSTKVGPVDVVFFTVKLYDSVAACAMLPPLLGPDTVVIPFQNGVESVEMLVQAVGRSHVAGGTAHVAAMVVEPGRIRHTALDLLIFGELDGARTPRLERLYELSRAAGFHATLSEQIEVEIWLKFVRLTAFSGMTTVTRSPLGVVREDTDLLTMLQAAVMEGMALAHATGIRFAPSALHEMLGQMKNMPPQTKSSMLQDLERGRPLELPWLSGAVVRLGEERGVSTPIHRFITTVLAPFVKGSPNPPLH
jgi:2-dehydropantoate 2-reductase